THGLKVEHGDYGRFVIQSEDPIVYLDPDFEGVSDAGWTDNPMPGNLILGGMARMPELDCLIDAQGRCFHGYSVAYGSKGTVRNGGGIRNCGGMGLYVRS